MEQLARASKSSAQWVRLNCCRCKAIRSFTNEIGVPIVRIGCSEFECNPNMGDASDIVCPYRSTLFHFDPSLAAHEADPADCAYGDMD